MEKPLSLTLFYTANIAGDLALLPRLFTFLLQLRTDARRPTLLLDLGGSCADEVWHCRVTGGRSTLIALDAMGYHVANVAGALDDRNREKLAEQVTMALVDESRDWLYRVPPVCDERIRVKLRARDDAARLQIVLSPAERTTIEGKRHLPGLPSAPGRWARRWSICWARQRWLRRACIRCRRIRRRIRASPGRWSSLSKRRGCWVALDPHPKPLPHKEGWACFAT